MTLAHEKEIETLRAVQWSGRDPEGRAFAPLADAYRRAGDFRRAADLLREGLGRLPDFATGHVVAARLYLERGLVEEAALSSRRALELDDGNVLAWGLLVGALEAKGAREEAAAARSRLGLLDPASVRRSEEPAGDAEAAAPDEEPVWDISALAPDEEPVWDVAALAPDEEPVWDISALAPDEEPLWDLAALAPDEEPVWDPAALAPDEEPAWDLAALAPDEEPLPEAPEPEPVVDVAMLAPVLDERVAETTPSVDRAPSGPAPPPDELLITRTMADLYVRQGLFDRALNVYRILRASDPADADLSARVEELEVRLGGTQDVAPSRPSGSEDDLADHAWQAAARMEPGKVETPFAWAEDESEQAPAGPPIGSYFRRLLSWEPGEIRTGETPDAKASAEPTDSPRWQDPDRA